MLKVYRKHDGMASCALVPFFLPNTENPNIAARDQSQIAHSQECDLTDLHNVNLGVCVFIVVKKRFKVHEIT